MICYPWRVASNDEQTPRRVGNYHLRGVVGRGGMGKVHVASVDEQPGVFFAIKEIHTFADDAASRLVLRDEARIASCISHPNVIPTLEVLETEEGIFMVMPFFRGISLGELLAGLVRAKRRVPPPVASAIVCQALEGLHAAHTAVSPEGVHLAIVHRDISPQNIHVGLDGIVRILDFGIAKARGRQQKTTKEGTLKGKLAYMPPEQIHGAELGAAADLYSMGVVLWETLACARLFAGSSEVDTFRKVLEGHVPALVPRVAGLPGAADSVLSKATNPNPAERYASAIEMREAVAHVLAPATLVEICDLVQSVHGSEREVHSTPVAPDGRKSAGLSSVSSGLAAQAPSAPAVVTALSSAPMGVAAPESHTRPLVVVAFALALMASILVFAGAGVRGSAKAEMPTEVPQVSTAMPVVPSSTLVVSHEADLRPAPSTAQADARAPAPNVATTHATPPRPTAPGSAAPAPAPAVAHPEADCATKWFYDADGHKKFKSQCF